MCVVVLLTMHVSQLDAALLDVEVSQDVEVSLDVEGQYLLHGH